MMAAAKLKAEIGSIVADSIRNLFTKVLDYAVSRLLLFTSRIPVARDERSLDIEQVDIVEELLGMGAGEVK